MNSGGDADDLTPAEQGLRQHLQLLRTDPPTPSTALTHRVLRTARWQRALRRPLLVVGSIAGALVDGIGLLFGNSRRSR